jgi:hypothetical protein
VFGNWPSRFWDDHIARNIANANQALCERLLDSRYASPVKKNSVLFRARNFCKAKDKECGAEKRLSRNQSHQGDKYATPDSTRG